MDKETKEYLDRKLLSLAQKEDIEKLRQETKVNFRQLKEEGKQTLEEREKARADVERLAKEWIAGMAPLREEVREGLQKLRMETGAALDQVNRNIESSLQRIREETKAAFDQLKQEMGSSLQLMREERKAGKEETKVDVDRIREGVEGLKEHGIKLAEEVGILAEKVKEGLIEVKEELGSMIKFSYADLEKRLATLEVKVKALEKMVLP
jgi:DNA anti-recombination protein RmuC